MPDKPCAPACERNRDSILAVLRRHFADRRRVLEIGSGTGQHAVHFARAMPWLSWQCTDRGSCLPGIGMWLQEAGLANTPPARALDVGDDWSRALSAGSGHPSPAFDAAFSANTLHILSWPEVEACFAGLADALAGDAVLAVYGPFNYGGAHTSAGNREFDRWLRARDPHSGLRDVEAVHALACGIGLVPVEDAPMPANNRCLVWRRHAPSVSTGPDGPG